MNKEELVVELLDMLDTIDNSGYYSPNEEQVLQRAVEDLRKALRRLTEGENVTFYKVEDCAGCGWELEDLDGIYYMDEGELKELANYYYENSDEKDKIDRNDLDVCIDFIRRVDRVNGETYNKEGV